MTVRLKADGVPFPGERADQVADWMATHGGRVCDCARALDLPFDTVKQAWKRVRQGLGEQAV